MMNRSVEHPQMQPAAISSPLPSTTISTCSSWAILDLACGGPSLHELGSLAAQSPRHENALTPAFYSKRLKSTGSSSPCLSNRDMYASGTPSEWSILYVDRTPTLTEWVSCDTPVIELNAEDKPAGRITGTEEEAVAGEAVTDVKENGMAEGTSANKQRQYFSFYSSSVCGLRRYSALPFVSHCVLHSAVTMRYSHVFFRGNELREMVSNIFLNPIQRFESWQLYPSEDDDESSGQSTQDTSPWVPTVVEEETPAAPADYTTEDACNPEGDVLYTPLVNIITLGIVLRFASLMFFDQFEQFERGLCCGVRAVTKLRGDSWCSIGHWFASHLESLAFSALHGIFVFVL